MEVWVHTVFLTSALDRNKRPASHPSHFTPVERAHGTHWIEHGVDPSAGWDEEHIG
jgi:hypothetical protein